MGKTGDKAFKRKMGGLLGLKSNYWRIHISAFSIKERRTT
jgi:hypothetical protein